MPGNMQSELLEFLAHLDYFYLNPDPIVWNIQQYPTI